MEHYAEWALFGGGLLRRLAWVRIFHFSRLEIWKKECDLARFHLPTGRVHIMCGIFYNTEQ